MPITRIISGAQTGADRGGLEAAIELGLDWGGWVPRGFRSQDGTIPAELRANLLETADRGYATRTGLNVRDSDGTVMISIVQPTSPGCALTAKRAINSLKPLMPISRMDDHMRWVSAVREWIDDHGIYVLNVAGNREESVPGIQAFTKRLLIAVLRG